MARGKQKRAEHEESEETLHTILRVAQRLFMEHGYRTVTTRQIADACGLTQPALYHYFSDKQELYVAIMHEEVAKMRAALERIARRGDSVDERLRRVVVYLLNTAQHDMDIMLHDIRHELSAEARDTLASIFQTGVVAPIATIFADGIAEGVLRDVAHDGANAVTATYLLLSMISRLPDRSGERESGASRHWQSATGPVAGPPPATSDDQLAAMIVRILLHGLANDHP